VKRFYFDHNATTPVSDEVFQAMAPMMTEVFGNASSIHDFGQQARHALDDARRRVAAMIGAAAEEIVFTSGGTEADNMALFGVGGHVITTSVEHPAVLHAAAQLPEVTMVPVDGRGVVDPDAVRKAIRRDTRLISVMHANNELGVIQPVEEIARIAREPRVLFHSDGVQGPGKLPVNVKELGVDLYSISAHKIYGPKGIGAIYVRSKGPRVRITPQMDGGGHERGMRSGTLNVTGIVGLGKACEIAQAEMAEETRRMLDLRNKLHISMAIRPSGCREI